MQLEVRCLAHRDTMLPHSHISLSKMTPMLRAVELGEMAQSPGKGRQGELALIAG